MLIFIIRSLLNGVFARLAHHPLFTNCFRSNVAFMSTVLEQVAHGFAEIYLEAVTENILRRSSSKVQTKYKEGYLP